MKNITLYNDDNLNVMAKMPDESIDVICIDPPYLYLKNQKLERAFDENKFFSECKRLLTKNGFIVMFGRGVSFYRWNTILADLGFQFKEEIVWDKAQGSSPLAKLNRIHETISIFGKGKISINKNKIPYVESRSFDIANIIADVKRLKSILKNTDAFEKVLKFLESKELINEEPAKKGIQITHEGIKKPNREVSVVNSIIQGMNEKSIIQGTERKSKYNSTVQPSFLINEDRNTAVIRVLENGLNEKSIIKQVRDHYTSIHPTQKPVRLLERLLALVIPNDKPKEEIVVADFFAGSMSCMEAVINMGMKGIAVEIDEEYFNGGKERIFGKEVAEIFTENLDF